ncbi:MAG: hypothetical protein K2X27_17510 [Candidatus Obscuribacterales bacterium]|nr:hypothetical protein [Candidatus Obscuribacterales bacterium]
MYRETEAGIENDQADDDDADEAASFKIFLDSIPLDKAGTNKSSTKVLAEAEQKEAGKGNETVPQKDERDSALNLKFEAKVKSSEASLRDDIHKASPAEKQAAAEIIWQQELIKLLQRMPEPELRQLLASMNKPQINDKEALLKAIKSEGVAERNDKFASDSISRQALEHCMDWFNKAQLNVHQELIKRAIPIPAGGPFFAQNSSEEAEQFNPIKDNYESFKGWLAGLNAEGLKKLSDKDTALMIKAAEHPSLDELLKFRDNMQFFEKLNTTFVQVKMVETANESYKQLKAAVGKEIPGWEPPTDIKQLREYSERTLAVAEMIKSLKTMEEVYAELSKLEGEFNKRENLAKDMAELKKKLEKEVPDSWQSTPENNRRILALQNFMDKHGEYISQAATDFVRGQFVRYSEKDVKGSVVKVGDKAVAFLDEKGKVDAFYRSGTEGKELLSRGLDGQFYTSSGIRVPGPSSKEQSIIDGGQKQNYDEIDYDGWKVVPGTGANTGKISVYVPRTYQTGGITGEEFAKTGEWRHYNPGDLVAVEMKDGEQSFIKVEKLESYLNGKENLETAKKWIERGLNIVMIASGAIALRAAVAVGSFAARQALIGSARATAGGLGFFDKDLDRLGTTGKILKTGSHIFIMGEVAHGVGAGKAAEFVSGKFLGKTVIGGKSAEAVAKVIEESKWMSQVQKVLHRSNQPLTSYLAYAMGRAEIEKQLGILPKRADSMTTAFRPERNTVIGGRKSQAASDKELAQFQKLLNSSSDGSAKFAEYFKKLTGSMNPSEKTSYAENLAKVFLGRKGFQGNGEFVYQPRGSENSEQRIIAAIALLYAARDQNGKLPDNGLLAEKLSPDNSPKNHAGTSIEQLILGGSQKAPLWFLEKDAVKNAILESLKESHARELEDERNKTNSVSMVDLLKVLQHEAFNGKDTHLRLMASEALFSLGIMQPADYAANILEIMEKNAPAATNEQKELMLKKVSDLLILRSSEFYASGMPSEEWSKIKDAANGTSPIELYGKLLHVANKDADADVRALAIGIIHAHQQPGNSVDLVDQQFSNYAEIKSKEGYKAGDYRKAFLGDLQRGLDMEISKVAQAEKEFALDRKLKVFDTLSLLDPKGEEAPLVNSLDRKNFLLKCLEDCSEESLSPLSSVKLIDRLLADSTLLDAESRGVIRVAALNILKLPHKNAERNEEAANYVRNSGLAMLTVINKLDQILVASADEERQAFAYELSKLISNQAKKDWGQYADLIVASIDAISRMGAADTQTLNSMTRFLDFDPTKTGKDSLLEQNPLIRASAAKAVYNLSGHRFATTKDIAELSKSNPQIKMINIEELLKRETDPAILDLLHKASKQNCRIDPESREYKELWEAEKQKFKNAKDTTWSKEDAEAFLSKRPDLMFLLPKNIEQAVQNKAKENYKDPYSGFGGAICEIWQNNSTIAAVKTQESKRATDAAREEYEKARDQAFDRLLKDGSEEALMMLKFIIMQGKELYNPPEQQKLAKTRSADALYNLCLSGKYPNAERLAQVIQKIISEIPAHADPEIKLRLYQSLMALSMDRTGKGPVISNSTAAKVLLEAFDKERGQVFKNTPENKANIETSNKLQIYLVEQLLMLRAVEEPAKLDFAGNSTESKNYLPEVAKAAHQVLDEMRNGIAYLYKDAVADKAGTTKEIKADYITKVLNDSRFNYEEACKAIFRACKDDPLTKESDARVPALMEALNHKSERVRLAAATILANSRINDLYIKANDCLCSLAVNGSKERYRLSAANLLEDKVIANPGIDKEFIIAQWKRQYDEKMIQLKSEAGKTAKDKEKAQELIKELEKNSPYSLLERAKQPGAFVSREKMEELNRVLPRTNFIFPFVDPTPKEFPNEFKMAEAETKSRLNWLRRELGRPELSEQDLYNAEALIPWGERFGKELRVEAPAIPQKKLPKLTSCIDGHHKKPDTEGPDLSIYFPAKKNLFAFLDKLSSIDSLPSKAPKVELPRAIESRTKQSPIEEKQFTRQLLATRLDQYKQMLNDGIASTAAGQDAAKRLVDSIHLSIKHEAIKSSDDPRVGQLVALSQDKNNLELSANAAALILSISDKQMAENPRLKIFSTLQIKLAEKELCRNAAKLTHYTGPRAEELRTHLARAIKAEKERESARAKPPTPSNP